MHADEHGTRKSCLPCTCSPVSAQMDIARPCGVKSSSLQHKHGLADACCYCSSSAGAARLCFQPPDTPVSDCGRQCSSQIISRWLLQHRKSIQQVAQGLRTEVLDAARRLQRTPCTCRCHMHSQLLHQQQSASRCLFC
jgi:hypothetical protein